jgi:hypothetical protein
MTATADKAPAALDLRWRAWLITEQLLAPGLDPAVSVAMLTWAFLDPVAYAKLRLVMAEHEATNTTVAEPDIPGAERFCGWCGATRNLVDDAVDPRTGERLGDSVWMCSDVNGCIDRRNARYPDDLDLIQAAKDKLNAAMAAAAPAVLALAAVRAAQDQHLALTAPRPAPSRTARQAAKWGHTLTSPAHRTHLLSRAR